MGRLDGQVAVVTGASSGIGEGLARMLAGNGATVALAAGRDVELRRVADLRQHGSAEECRSPQVHPQLQIQGGRVELVDGLEDGHTGRVERGRGFVVNVASEAGVVTFAGLGGYAISRHGVCALTRLVVEENQDRGIKAWAICPGMVDTPMTEDAPE